MSLQDPNNPVHRFGPRRATGRPKGIPNKTTKDAKQALEAAFEGMGGVPRLLAWGQANPGEFYKLWSKLIPTNVKAELHGGITLTPVINLSGRPEHVDNQQSKLLTNAQNERFVASKPPPPPPDEAELKRRREEAARQRQEAKQRRAEMHKANGLKAGPQITQMVLDVVLPKETDEDD